MVALKSNSMEMFLITQSNYSSWFADEICIVFCTNSDGLSRLLKVKSLDIKLPQFKRKRHFVTGNKQKWVGNSKKCPICGICGQGRCIGVSTILCPKCTSLSSQGALPIAVFAYLSDVSYKNLVQLSSGFTDYKTL